MQRTISRPTTAQADQPATGLRWEVWLLRAFLAASASFAVLVDERGSALAAVVALALTWLPALVAERGSVRTPRLVEALWALTVTIPAASDALGLYDRITHWGKLVHGVEGGLLAGLTAFLLLAH